MMYMMLWRVLAVLSMSLLLQQATALPTLGQDAPVAGKPTMPAVEDGRSPHYMIGGRVVNEGGFGLQGLTVTATAQKYPIILLPGAMGTNLRNYPDNDLCPLRPAGTVWLQMPDPNSLEPLYLAEDGYSPREPCDNIVTDGWVAAPYDPYDEFVKAAEAAGFVVIHYSGFDWRYNLTAALDDLQSEIDSLTSPSAGGVSPKVYLVADGVGGLVARAFAGYGGNVDGVAGIVTIGTPYLGAPALAQRLVTGMTGNPMEWLLDPAKIREINRNAPGVQELLPSLKYLEGVGGYYLPATGALLDTYQDTIDYFDEQRYAASSTVALATSFHAGLDGFDAHFDIADRYAALYSLDSTTPATLRERRCWYGSQHLCVDVYSWRMGDGTVPSGSSDLRWLPAEERAGVDFCGYTGFWQGYKEHRELLRDPRVITDVLHILNGEPAEFCDSNAAQQPVAGPTGFRSFVVWGDGKVRMIDPAGAPVGRNDNGAQHAFTGVDDIGILYRQIADVAYLLTDGGAIVTMPADATYQLEIVQTGNQPMQVMAYDYVRTAGRTAGDAVYVPAAQALFDHVPATVGAVATVTVASAPLMQLSLAVDADGDGYPETTLAPDVVLDDPLQIQDRTMPSTTIAAAGPQDGEGNYTDAVTVTLTAEDTESGVLKSFVSVDGGKSWQAYSAPISVQPGQSTTVLAYSVDRAGNQEYPPQTRVLHFESAVHLYLPTVVLATDEAKALPAPALNRAKFAPSSLPVVPQAEKPHATQFITGSLIYSTVTDRYGNYLIRDLPPNYYDVTVHVEPDHIISPTQQTVTLRSDATDVDFVRMLDAANEIRIPAGEFQMGCDSAVSACSDDNLPLHTVYLDTYWIDKYEVTNGRYKKCVDAGVCIPPYEDGPPFYYGLPEYNDNPVTSISWSQASVFCSWEGRRLPTEAEWEKAARGDSDTRRYPWGNNDFTCDLANGYFFSPDGNYGCTNHTIPVGSHPAGASPFGVLDMAGNATEWVNDWYQEDYYSVSPLINPTGPVTGTEHGARGGGYASTAWHLQVYARMTLSLWNSRGFRCARSE